MRFQTEPAVALLMQVRRSGSQIERLPEEAAPPDLEAAYAVQEAAIPALLELSGGGRLLGWKIGATNPPSQQALSLEAPFLGPLLSPDAFASPAELPQSRFFAPRLEAEIAFRMGRDLPAAGAPYDEAAVRQAVAAVLPAIEVVDSRLAAGFGAGGLQMIADHGVNAAWIHGSEATDLSVCNYDDHPVRLLVNGAEKQRGSSANVLGSPIKALCWLANALAARGQGLQAGQYVSTGTCTPAEPAPPGCTAEADFGPLGRVSLRLA